jgi:hypothetical protein
MATLIKFFREETMKELTLHQASSISGGYQVLEWQPGDEHTAFSWSNSTRLGGEEDYKDCGTTMFYKNCGEDNASCEFVVRFDYCGMRGDIW